MGQGRLVNLGDFAARSLKACWSNGLARHWPGLCRGTSTAGNAIVDLMFPPACLACDREIAPQPWLLCRDCRESFRYPPGGICPTCAAPAVDLGTRLANCVYCRRRKYRFASTVALGTYAGQLREVVLRTKQSFHEPLARTMGNCLGEYLFARVPSVKFDGVVPVPMHWFRRMLRGVPAAESLAEGVADATRWPLVVDLVRCRRSTRKQGTLLPGERFQNVADAFAVADHYQVRGTRLLIVDDVMTTGATVNAIAKALLRQGAAEVHVAVLARGTGLGR